MKMSILEIDQERCKVHKLERKIQNKNCFNYMIRSITITNVASIYGIGVPGALRGVTSMKAEAEEGQAR